MTDELLNGAALMDESSQAAEELVAFYDGLAKILRTNNIEIVGSNELRSSVNLLGDTIHEFDSAVRFCCGLQQAGKDPAKSGHDKVLRGKLCSCFLMTTLLRQVVVAEKFQDNGWFLQSYDALVANSGSIQKGMVQVAKKITRDPWWKKR